MFGALKGTLTASVNSVTNPTNATGSVFVQPGDLIWVTFGQQTGLTATSVTDNLGNTYSAVNAGTDIGTVTQRCFYSRVTAIGTLTTVAVAATASTNDASCSVDVIEGPFLVSPLDANPGNTSDATTPFTCPATGTLAQADEIVMAGISNAATQTFAATSPSLIGATVSRANISTGNSRRVVTATTSVVPEFTGTSAVAVQTTASFRKDTTAARKQHDWPNPKGHQRAIDLRTWAYNLTLGLPIPIEYTGFPSMDWPSAPAPERPVSLRTWTHFNINLYPPSVVIAYTGFPSMDWPPAPAAERSVTLRTWIHFNINLFSPVSVALPVGDRHTNLTGRGPLQPLRNWTLSLQQTTLAPEAPTPFKQLDWPNPRGSLQPLRNWTFSYNLNLIGQDQLPVGDRITTLPPRGHIHPNSIRTWVQTVNLALVTEAAALPHNQYNWPNPQQIRQSTRSWTAFYNRNLIGQDQLPIGDNLYTLSPRGHTHSSDLRTWIGRTIRLLASTQPIGERITAAPSVVRQPVRTWISVPNPTPVVAQDLPIGAIWTDLPMGAFPLDKGNRTWNSQVQPEPPTGFNRNSTFFTTM